RLIADFNMKPVFVFDGKPNPLKRRTIEMRREARKKAEAEYVKAVTKKDYAKAWSKAVMTGRVTGSVLDDTKRLLTLMGIPWLEALEDAEAQASHMAARGDVWAVGSKDYDCLLYGTPILARYLTLTGREWLPAQQRSRPLIPELIKLSENLALLEITREQLVDLAILVGTDFNQGVKGIGPKKALKLAHDYGSIEQMPEEIRSKLTEDLNSVRRVFLKPRVLEENTRRNEKTLLISEVFRRIRSEDVSYVTLFLAGKPFPEADPRVLEISYATLSTAGKTMSQTLLTEDANPLTITEVFSTLG